MFFHPIAEGQIRGLPWVAPAMVRLWLLDQYDDAELDRKKVCGNVLRASLLGPVRTTSWARTARPRTPMAPALLGLQPGTMQLLLPGEDIKFFRSRRCRRQLRSLSISQPYSPAALPWVCPTPMSPAIFDRPIIRAFGKASWSFAAVSNRSSTARWSSNYAGRSGTAGCGMRCSRVRSTSKTSPTIRAPTCQSNGSPPKWDWVDPFKDRKAEIEAIEAGLKSRSDVIESEGYDAEEVDRRIAADKAREQELGLSFDAQAKASPDPDPAADDEDVSDPAPTTEENAA